MSGNLWLAALEVVRLRGCAMDLAGLVTDSFNSGVFGWRLPPRPPTHTQRLVLKGLFYLSR